MTATLPVDDGLFARGEGGPALLGSSCRACGTTTFPRQASCPRCTREDMADRVLPRRGTLWTFTVQRFRPKPPYAGPDGDFVPYGVGYIELPGEPGRDGGPDLAGVLVEARLTENDPAALAIGAPMELVEVPFRREPDGTTVVTFAFRPVG